MKKAIQDIFQILNPREKQHLWQLTVADVFISLLDIAFLIALLFVVNFYTQPRRVLPPLLSRVNLFNEHPLMLILVFFLLFTLKNIVGYYVSKWQYQFVYGVASRISRDGLLQYLSGPYTDYVHVDSSVINRRISQQPVEFCHYVLNGVQQVFSQAVLVIITCLAIIWFNPLLFPLLIIILAPPVYLISWLMKRKLNATRLQGKNAGEKSIQHIQEALSGYVESNIYQKNAFFTNRYHRYQSELNRHLSERLVIQNMPSRLIEVFAVFGLLILIWVNSLSSHSYSIRLVTIGALMVAAYKIIPGIVRITNTIGQIKNYGYTTEGLVRVGQFTLNQTLQNEPLEFMSLENIYFSFQGKKVLQGFSMEIKKGDLVGILGLSGRGKTTVINLLLGFLTPDSGSLYFNGTIADTENRKKYWGRVAYIKQQHFFLHASILENITLQEKDFDRDRIARILVQTGIDQVIKSFPEGLNTLITENGKNFSGGQRQRFIFARALYKDFDLLILDEPFNELDEKSETDMLRQLKTIAAGGKMVILITHNTEALSFCNRKIIMDAEG